MKTINQNKESKMNFTRPNTLISYKKMKAMTRLEIVNKIKNYEPINNIGGLPPELYFNKSNLMDILNFALLNN